jgi:hypothetical protein
MTSEDQIRVLLSNCSKEQLNTYLNDETSLRNLIDNLDTIRKLQYEKYEIDRANKELAKTNLEKEPLIESLKEELTKALDDLDSAKADYYNLVSNYSSNTMNDNLNDLSLEAVYTMLQTSANKAEEETEQMADDFYSSESCKINTDEELAQFHKLFLEQRIQAHLKKIKADKMKELLNNGTY